jgi:uncharacterized delta-60 repeat protein
MHVLRVDGNGALDCTFNDPPRTLPCDGYGTYLNTSPAGYTTSRSVLVQLDGRIVVTGYAQPDFLAVRLLGDGTLDGSFGTGGIVQGGAAGYALALQADGRILVNGTGGLGLRRLHPDGAWDTSFGADGNLGAPVGELAQTVVLDAYGRILVAGLDTSGGQRSFALARFRLDAQALSFCDATDGALAECPCANPGAPDSGCDVQQATGGVRLDVLAQVTAPQSAATLQGTGFPPAGEPIALVIRGDALDPARPVAFGDGLRCIAASGLVRLAATAASAGTSMHAFGHGAGAGAFHYQLWFRNTPASYCDPAAAFNLSNGRTLVWP